MRKRTIHAPHSAASFDTASRLASFCGQSGDILIGKPISCKRCLKARALARETCLKRTGERPVWDTEGEQ